MEISENTIKICDRLVSFFFAFLILSSVVGILMVLLKIPIAHQLVNPLLMFISSGIFAGFLTVLISRRELEQKEKVI